jgi:hypothetical protein
LNDGAPLFSLELAPTHSADFMLQPWLIPGFTDQLVAAGPDTLSVVMTEGFLIATILAAARFSGFATIDTDLYVLDGPVLLKYDISSLSSRKQVDGPDLAVNVQRRNSRRYDPKTGGPWSSAKAWLYPQAGETVPAYAAPLVAYGQDANLWVFVLGGDGSVRGIDTSFTTWVVGQHGVPDALLWRVELRDGEPGANSLCYASENSIIALDATSASLPASPIDLPDVLPNGVAWARARNTAEAPVPFVVFPNAQHVVCGSGTFMCDAAYGDGITLTLFDFGADGPPQFGQAQIPANPAPAALPSAVLSIPDVTLAGPILLADDGDRKGAYVPVVDASGATRLQRWRFAAPTDDAVTRGRWNDAVTGVQVSPGYMEALCPASAVPAGSWDPWTTCGIAAMCLPTGITGAFA